MGDKLTSPIYIEKRGGTVPWWECVGYTGNGTDKARIGAASTKEGAREVARDFLKRTGQQAEIKG